MSETVKWFKRKFVFDFPVELYPNLRVRLRGSPARLEELLRGLAPQYLTAKLEGKWSMQEHAGHLADLEPLWPARLEDYLAGAEKQTAADLTNRKTHEAGHDQRPVAEILQAFRTSRMAFVEKLEGLSADVFSRTALHPRLNTSMRLVDHLFFVAEHDDHHLARIWELSHTG